MMRFASSRSALTEGVKKKKALRSGTACKAFFTYIKMND